MAAAQDAQWVAAADGKWSCVGCRPPPAPAAAAPADANRLRDTTILIAEDHADSREALREYLDQFGATCLESTSGSEALDAFRRSRPDILLADVWMPDVDGLELIRRIRSLLPEDGCLTPAIAVSAQVNDEQALMAGYHAVIAKPYDPASVVRMVEEFVRPASVAPVMQASWTVVARAPGAVVITLAGNVGAADARACIGAVLGHLDSGSHELVVDLRRVTGLSAAVSSVAQHALWPKRHAIRHVHIVAGTRFARVVASACCRLLGLGCTVDSEVP